MKSNFLSLSVSSHLNFTRMTGLILKNKLIVLFIILISSIAFAQIPRTISYQGVLTDSSGNPKPDGNYSFKFSLYENKTGGNAIWSENKTLTVTKGLFSTLLGDKNPFSDTLKFDKPYWLGIELGSDPELSPRIALTSAGYSFTSINSDTAKDIVDGKVVKSLNGLKDNVKLLGGGGTTINTSGDTIMISSSSSGGSGIQGLQNSDGTIDITNPNGPTATLNLKVPLQLSGNADLVFSSTASDSGIGIKGNSLGSSATNDGKGIYGESKYGIGIQGSSDNYVGVWGTSGSTASGVVGTSPSGPGVQGQSTSLYGVEGKSESGDGVYGESANINGVEGHGNYGVLGITNNATSGIGVRGGGPYGVWGQGVGSSSIGVYGIGITGVYGEGSSGYGILGITHNSTALGGVYGNNSNSPNAYGILGGYKTGVYGYGATGNSAGTFNGSVLVVGNLAVSGTITAGTKDFKIDDPLDPANKYLVHSCIESPDRLDVYSGNITTDANGLATVKLPAYFQALNIDYRYQLTVIGQFAQGIVERKIQNNQFTIKTNKPNVEVSWQVTGVRNDPYAKANPMVVEQKKEASSRGKYLHPELYGQPKEDAIGYVKMPEIKPVSNLDK